MRKIENGEIKRIIVFGDSIVYGSNDWVSGGWVVHLKNYFAKTGQFHHVFNMGVSGENSDNILQRIESEIQPRKSEKPNKKSLLIVGISLNDTKISDSMDAEPEISIDKFLKNLERFHNIGTRNADEFVFVGMTRVDENKTNPWQEVIERRIACFRNDIIERYNQEAKKYCEDNGIDFIETMDILENSDLPDGLHPNEVGHDKIYKRIKDHLVSKDLIKKV